MDTITLTLTAEEAASFRAWREHQGTFELLLAHQIFEIRNGSAELHFNAAGQIASIDAHVKVFRLPKAQVMHTVIVEPSRDTPARGVQ